jgi:protocatechuate 3,4-dioxygenase beta subunit
MKSQRAFLLVTLIVMVVAVVWFVRRQISQVNPKLQPLAIATMPSNPEVQVATNNSSSNQTLLAIVGDSKNASNQAGVRASYRQGIISKDEAMKQMIEAKNIPVAFYGKVIDQDGQPISGARVTLEPV